MKKFSSLIGLTLLTGLWSAQCFAQASTDLTSLCFVNNKPASTVMVQNQTYAKFPHYVNIQLGASKCFEVVPTESQTIDIWVNRGAGDGPNYTLTYSYSKPTELSLGFPGANSASIVITPESCFSKAATPPESFNGTCTLTFN